MCLNSWASFASERFTPENSSGRKFAFLLKFRARDQRISLPVTKTRFLVLLYLKRSLADHQNKVLHTALLLCQLNAIKIWANFLHKILELTVIQTVTSIYLTFQEHPVAHTVEALRYEPQRRGFRFPMASFGFSFDLIRPYHVGPGVDSASNGNEYQGYILWGKGGRCVELTTLPPSCAV